MKNENKKLKNGKQKMKNEKRKTKNEKRKRIGDCKTTVRMNWCPQSSQKMHECSDDLIKNNKMLITYVRALLELNRFNFWRLYFF